MPADSAWGDPVYNGLMDACLGHTSQQEYHYHALLVKCLTEAGLGMKGGIGLPGGASPAVNGLGDGEGVGLGLGRGGEILRGA